MTKLDSVANGCRYITSVCHPYKIIWNDRSPALQKKGFLFVGEYLEDRQKVKDDLWNMQITGLSEKQAVGQKYW